MRPSLPQIIGGVVGVAFLALLPSAITIVPEDTLADQEASEAFDAPAFVDGIWESEIVPTVQRDAVDLAVVLGAFEVAADGQADKEQLIDVAEEYGSITDGEAHVYLVRGAGTVTAIDARGLMTVQLDGYDGPVEVVVFMGTRIPSDETSVRDAVGFIEFGDFKEQTEYGKVASEINRRIVRDVIAPLADAELVGKQITFLGAMGIRTFNLVQIDLSAVRIVPVEIAEVDA